MVRFSKRLVQWPCGICGIDCKNDCVYCDGCHIWNHAVCDQLMKGDLNVVSKLQEDYLCSYCTNIAGIGGALNRMKNYKGTLFSRMKMEAIYMKRTPLELTRKDDADSRQIDPISEKILKYSG